MDQAEIVRQAAAAAAEFNARRLWKRFTNSDCFAVTLNGGEPLLGIVMGGGGEQYGLMLLRGRNAPAAFAALTHPAGVGDDLLDDLDMLSFSMEAFGAMTPDSQKFLRKAGLEPRHGEKRPEFMVKPARRVPRVPDEGDLRLFLTVLRGAVEADKRGLLEPARLDSAKGVCVLDISGDADRPRVSVSRRRLDADREVAEPAQIKAADLAGLPRLDAAWLVGMPTLPGRVKGDDHVMCVLLVMDEDSEMLLQSKLLAGGGLQEAADAVVRTIRQVAKGLPHTILFTSRRLRDAMAPVLKQVHVKCQYMPFVPKLAHAAAEMFEFLEVEPPPRPQRPDTPRRPEPVGPPRDDDLAGWKEADRRLAVRFAEYLHEGPLLRSRGPAKQYFRQADPRPFLKKHETKSVANAYSSWGVLAYRPKKDAPTHAEAMLANGLPPAEAALLRARMDAPPTLYRVAAHDARAGTIDLEDVLLGGAVTIHDKLMSENIDDGVFLAARTFPAGRFRFIDFAGPPLTDVLGMEAVGFLRSCRLELTPEGLRRDAHVFGWLWTWMEEAKAALGRRPRLCNTDGEELLWHTASFAVADAGATRAALLRREDIRPDEEAGELVWGGRTKDSASLPGDGLVTLGRMEFVGDELVLTVNSAGRLARAREWLEAMPGVTFRGVTKRRWDEPEKDRPLDERTAEPQPVEMTPELAAHVQETMDRHYMRWLDQPLPVLAGRTPRQACRSEEGRRHVAALIRTIPAPAGPAPVRVPRQAMLRELGLEAGPGEEGPPEAQPPAARAGAPAPLPGQYISRNRPCPCGSGHKYKKCCGRNADAAEGS